MKKRPLMFGALFLIVWVIVFYFLGFEKEIVIPRQMEGKMISCSGSVYKIEYKKDKIQLSLHHIQMNEIQKIPSKYKIQILLKKEQYCAIGNEISVKGNLVLADLPSNEGQFDFAFYQRTNQILFTLRNAEIQIQKDSIDYVRQNLWNFRNLCRQKMLLLFGEKDGGILCSILLGDKTYLDETIQMCYQASGIAHILAISGLHISMFGMALYRFLKKCGISFLFSALFSGAFMFFYLIFTGAGMSTCRAVIMFLVFLLAQCLGRTYDLLSSLSFAMILLLLSNPMLLFSAGFQMSILAVVAIGGVVPRMKKRFWKKLPAGLGVQLLMLPCLLWHYFVFPLYGIFLNLIVIPILPVVLMGSALVLLLSFLGFPFSFIGVIPIRFILSFYEIVCRFSLKLPFSQLVFGRPKIWSVILYFCVLCAVLYLPQKEEKKAKKNLIFLIFAIFLLVRQEKADFSVSFLDVGQGDSIFFQKGNQHRFLCDGGSSSIEKAGTYRILPFLKYQGISELDYVFLTHMDEDHINGVREILESEFSAIKIKMLVLPKALEKEESYQKMEKLAEKRKIPVKKMKAGDQIVDGDLKITCLHPHSEFSSENKNEQSLVLHVNYKELDVMLMGDLEKEGEKELLKSELLKKQKSGKKIEILKVGHHGSKGATSEEFLAFLRPQTAILSYGKNNRYGHPAEETLERLKKAGTQSFSTEKYGEITILYRKNKKITVRYGKNMIKYKER